MVWAKYYWCVGWTTGTGSCRVAGLRSERPRWRQCSAGVAEETGVVIKVTGVLDVYSDPGHVLAYRHGDMRQQFAVCFHALAVDGERSR